MCVFTLNITYTHLENCFLLFYRFYFRYLANFLLFCFTLFRRLGGSLSPPQPLLLTVAKHLERNEKLLFVAVCPIILLWNDVVKMNE